jgi:hypothetical protein
MSIHPRSPELCIPAFSRNVRWFGWGNRRKDWLKKNERREVLRGERKKREILRRERIHWETLKKIDFLRHRSEDRFLSKAAAKLSENAFQKVWSNPEDDDYDRL